MAYRILESKFPLMDEEYRTIMNGATVEMLDDDGVILELMSLGLTATDVEVVNDVEELINN